jgi:hypothetical protein
MRVRLARKVNVVRHPHNLTFRRSGDSPNMRCEIPWQVFGRSHVPQVPEHAEREM